MAANVPLQHAVSHTNVVFQSQRVGWGCGVRRYGLRPRETLESQGYEKDPALEYGVLANGEETGYCHLSGALCEQRQASPSIRRPWVGQGERGKGQDGCHPNSVDVRLTPLILR